MATSFLDHGIVTSDRGPEGGFETLRILSPVFRELWSIYELYLTNTNPKDLPWWYTERMIVGHLTAAAFRAGLIAAEEFQCLKGEGNGSGPQRKGRADWWVGTHKCQQDVWVEAKQVYVPADRGWGPFETQMEEATRDVSKCEIDELRKTRRLAVVFVRPYYHEKKEHGASRKRFLDAEYYPPRVDYFAYYWLRDGHRDEYCVDGYCYPGLMICCKEVAITQQSDRVAQPDLQSANSSVATSRCE